jgi:DNA modification methylase
MDDWTIDLMLGDCLDMLKDLDDNSVDAVVTDPPYGLSFMGKKWDYDVPSEAIWRECLRVLKPGGHLLAFAGTRTQHRMAVRIEDAGFEIRDMIAWVYGSGFPKSLDVSKAIDKAAGAAREVVGFDAEKAKQQTRAVGTAAYGDYAGNAGQITVPATDAAQQWEGWGTALKPALEPLTVARKPLIGTVAANVLEHGTGALNIDGCRVPYEDTPNPATNPLYRTQNGYAVKVGSDASGSSFSVKREGGEITANPQGRWPANLIHDSSDAVLALFPGSKGQQGDVRGTEASRTGGDGTNCYGEYGRVPAAKRGDSGAAARFFYCSKASKKDRNEGLPPGANRHETVKPTDLMAYLCRLVTPPGGVVLDPFMGSGSTGKAAMREGFRFIGIERDPDYFDIAEARIMAAKDS